MRDNRDDGAIRIAVLNADNQNRATLAVIPRSNSQTSPRLGGILFVIQESEQKAASLSDLRVRDRTGIKRQFSRAPQYLYRESLSVAWRQGFKCHEEFDCMLTHTFKLTVFQTESNAARGRSRMPAPLGGI